jgi:thioredoxin 1
MDELEQIKQKKLQEMMKKAWASGSSEISESKEEWPAVLIEVTDATFKETIQKYPLVAVDCWAEWCAPCLMVAPVLEELARDYTGKIVFARLNVDSNRGTASAYGIMSIPTLLVFKKGELIDQIVGAMPRNMLEPKITQHL